ncbi:MAG: hypothetical protein RL598_1869, partial [Verrucomicrobiota bacterium]
NLDIAVAGLGNAEQRDQHGVARPQLGRKNGRGYLGIAEPRAGFWAGPSGCAAAHRQGEEK